MNAESSTPSDIARAVRYSLLGLGAVFLAVGLFAFFGRETRQEGLTRSPDGRTLAYTSITKEFAGGELERAIYLKGPDGTPRKLTNGDSPAWSPDGKRIAFIRWPGQLWIIQADGTGELQLPAGEKVRELRWSPDGRRIAFATNHIFVIDADGKNLRQLTRIVGLDVYPEWTADGRKITFYHRYDYPPYDSAQFEINTDGTGWNRIGGRIKHPPRRR